MSVVVGLSKRPAGPEKDGMMMNCWYDVMTIVVDVERTSNAALAE